MATMNVIMQANGQPRYSMVPNEVRDLARGKFGKTPKPVKPEVLAAMKIKPQEMITDCAVEDAKAPKMADFRKELAAKKVEKCCIRSFSGTVWDKKNRFPPASTSS